MKTVSVITKNSELKEKLLVDLTSIGYRVLLSEAENPDIVIADFDELASISKDTEKIILTVLTAPTSNHTDLLAQADDLLFYPYDIHELELRLKLALFKHGEYEAKPDERTLTVDGLTINFDSYEVTIDGEPLDLTFKEYELLKCLITNRGRVYTRDQLLSTVWGYDYYGGARTVDVHIRRLRSKLGRHESLIETVRNVGYRFKR